MAGHLACLLALLITSISALKYDEAWKDYNLNQNQNAQTPLEYDGEWTGHTYTKSPDNWRFPFYTLFLDKFVNGDPTNDNINGTQYEQDVLSNQLRHGGDVQGLIDTLDYLKSLGIKGIYIAGSPFINQPWGADQYSPLDMTLLDPHMGTIDTWRNAINEIHSRGMYVLMDNTMATMGDLLGFDGYMNTTTPFTLDEHKLTWKNDRRYLDFDQSNNYNSTCKYPRFWLETGLPVGPDVTDRMKGCYDSEFDQYGDTEAFGVFPDWQRQLAKFASVQDRLREWHAPTLAKINRFSCITIKMLDIDGFRFDKATQVTVDAQGDFGEYMRQCAKSVGKNNFFMPGEITGGNTFGSIYIGRGRQPDMLPKTLDDAVTMTNTSDEKFFIRDQGKGALDAAAFHYSVYRTLSRFLGMDGNLEAGYDVPRNWVDMWNTMLLSNDLVNAETGKFDPRHMYGVTNQDVFRWPAIANGTQRELLGLFITTLHMPGIPLLLWGEEQAYYILDNTASNYIFGRQPISPSIAWQEHGCYQIGAEQFYAFPDEDNAKQGCKDDSVSLDHRDPSHPVHNIIRHMYYMRSNYPVLNDGYFLQQLSNQTHILYLPGSNQTATERGMWSVWRSNYDKYQDLGGSGMGNQSVWLLYHNENSTKDYQFDCSDSDKALISPFAQGTTVKNLFYPHEEIKLDASPKKLGINGSTDYNGCKSSMSFDMFGFKAFVPSSAFVSPPTMVTLFKAGDVSPGHDARLLSKVAPGQQETIDIEFQLSANMSCDAFTAAVNITSSTEDKRIAQIKSGSASCTGITDTTTPKYVGAIPGVWSWKGTLENVSNGVHAITLKNVTGAGNSDRFLFRVGQNDNPMVFKTANYTRALIHKEDNGTYYISHKSAGADLWRYTTNWGSSWSNWLPYNGGNETITLQDWTGTKKQAWSGVHINTQYWNRLTGSSSVIMHADLDWPSNEPPRRFPHLYAHGLFNQFGFDSGLKNTFKLDKTGRWRWHFMYEWPTTFQINVWGVNPDGKPDQTGVYGDVDGDGVLDRLPPSSLSPAAVTVDKIPPSPYLAWQFALDDGLIRLEPIPVGNRWQQLAVYILLWIVPVLTAAFGVWLYMQSFYQVKFNQIGISKKTSLIPTVLKTFGRRNKDDPEGMYSVVSRNASGSNINLPGVASGGTGKRRVVLIATMEYDIEDWAIKIKIGGLGVMAQLMGKNLGHQDLIWVVPCVGGVDYPMDQPAAPMYVTILGKQYEIQVQYHILRNITYVLLDAPVFRKQTKSEPYPPRMDDLDSAIYYSAWNACIAEAIKRFPVDLYHINDYHGAAAPLYLLPSTIPCCLSLHNAEFQGLWPMRTPKERQEVADVFNLSPEIIETYVQFGAVFNLLHAGASYLRVHQKGFGAVGVSSKYGARSYARYPIFWGLSKIGKLPNPDPSDTGEWNKELPKEGDIHIDPKFEAGRSELKRQAQEWAGLNQDADAELFVFVGRWSMQKGVDLIADVFPMVLEQHPKVQLVAIGPVIDLYGRFAALKLEKLMERYPGRVFSKPEFTALPPYIFSGAEFALIPSRDEPFGLVAVEFGRKGALGVGARVGGLGQMPGWWYTVESVTTSHLIKQFREAIEAALASKTEVRAMMRARSAKQRFPVAQWVEDLEKLQTTAIRIHDKEAHKSKHVSTISRPQTPTLGSEGPGLGLAISTPASGMSTPDGARSRNSSITRAMRAFNSSTDDLAAMRSGSPAAVAERIEPVTGLKRGLSLGKRTGPGQLGEPRGRPGRPRVASAAFSDVSESENEHITDRIADEYTMTYEEAELARAQTHDTISPMPHGGSFPPLPPPPGHPGSMPGTPGTPGREFEHERDSLLVPPTPGFYGQQNNSRLSVLSVESVVGTKTDFKLQKVDPSFTDSNGEFYHQFEQRLKNLDAKNSDTELCIEDYLVKSEKQWFDRFRDARLGKSAPSSPAPSVFRQKREKSTARESMASVYSGAEDGHDSNPSDEFLLGQDYKPPTGLKKYFSMRVGDWPVYSLFLALGQILAANSYQITLLTGEVGQAASKLYVIASIYLIASVGWWVCFRMVKSMYCLCIPFALYGLAFFLIGMAPMAPLDGGRPWIQNVASGAYAVASASGSLFFALNFGDEGGAPVKDWVWRACIIQGTQQIYVCVLWYWGSVTVRQTSTGVSRYTRITTSSYMAAICVPVAVFMWAISIGLFFGLPDFYRQAPGKIKSFYQSIFRRKIIGWFFVTVIIQNYFLSAPYGRNWAYLWSSKACPAWAIILLIVLFYIVAWAGFLWIFAVLSKDHSWIMPIFAIGLGAPRWCQMLWGTSGYGQYIPWLGGPVTSAVASRSLWLWLGLLDTIQGCGFGMILLQTLTRVHVAFTLVAAQVLGSIATILARATAPNAIGPGDVFPDFSEGLGESLNKAWFWIPLLFQIMICVGFFMFFRKEQLSKP